MTLALLGSYAVQSDLGDYDPSKNGQGFQYLKDISFAPKQTQELLEKVAELHITHRLCFIAKTFVFFLALSIISVYISTYEHSVYIVTNEHMVKWPVLKLVIRVPFLWGACLF